MFWSDHHTMHWSDLRRIWSDQRPIGQPERCRKMSNQTNGNEPMSKDGRVDSYGIHNSGASMKKGSKEPKKVKKSSASNAVFTSKDELDSQIREEKIREEKRPEETPQRVRPGKEFSLRVTKA